MTNLVYILFLVLALASCTNKKNATEAPPKAYLRKLDSIKLILEEGDIVFRGGTDIESSIIRDFSVFDKQFSHVGIA